MCEIQRAEITLVKLVQQMEFNSEIKDLSCKGMVNPQSKIRNLSPFLDSENVLRVGGRLAHSKLCFDKKHQIILPNNHRLTNLILEMTHKRHLHVSPQTLLSIVRQRFWPLNGRNMCRKLVNNCIICFKAKPVTCSQIMGQLPAERISQSFPFNKAPNHGGLWEAGVKAVKYHLRRVMGNLRFTYEEFLTILNQIEGVLNSRPLYPLSCDPGDFDALTPGHFLVGRPITAIAEPSLTEVSDNRLKVWQKQTKIVQHIWKRWSNNYLSTLQNRNKWYFEKNNVKIHDMVILKEDNLPVCNWPLGRILEVYHGKDNKIRVVLVKTKNGIFKRQ
ncbi:integrase catalytic domain-containing protein [Trichonephila clavipes]|nr:integrase catalytic domain-containing protein [Trichonephila clavipes]